MATIRQLVQADLVAAALVLAVQDLTEQVAPELQIPGAVLEELKIRQHQHTAKVGLEL
jgi:hypothetical protein